MTPKGSAININLNGEFTISEIFFNGNIIKNNEKSTKIDGRKIEERSEKHDFMIRFSVACFITLWKKENENEFYGKMQ